MMKKRDLKADLELFNRATPAPWEFGPIYDGTIAGELDEERHRANRELLNNFREGWPHAIERAIKAEALVRELVHSLKLIRSSSQFSLAPLPGTTWEEITDLANIAIICAEEVLGDET